MPLFIEQLAEAIVKRNNLEKRVKTKRIHPIQHLMIKRNLPLINRDIEKAKRWLQNCQNGMVNQ